MQALRIHSSHILLRKGMERKKYLTIIILALVRDKRLVGYLSSLIIIHEISVALDWFKSVT